MTQAHTLNLLKLSRGNQKRVIEASLFTNPLENQIFRHPKMLSRAFAKPRKSPGGRDEESSQRSVSIYEYEDCIFGFMDINVPVNFCYADHDSNQGSDPGFQMTLRELLRSSVGVMGEGRLGITEKVVLPEGRVCAVKRFRKVSARMNEFGRRIQRLSQVARTCQYLVPVTAYLYAKRIRFVVCDYYPMGSLADLLAGARELGHTALAWNHRFVIILNVARAIDFIHTQSPQQDKRLQMNVHGSIKASNIMINVDFTACLSDYGFAQLAEQVEASNTRQQKPPPPPKNIYCDTLCQKSDIYNFGMIMLDILGGPTAPGLRTCIIEKKEEINNGECEFFEVTLRGKENKQALQVLDIALSCTSSSPESRPSIKQILYKLGIVN